MRSFIITILNAQCSAIIHSQTSIRNERLGNRWFHDFDIMPIIIILLIIHSIFVMYYVYFTMYILYISVVQCGFMNKFRAVYKFNHGMNDDSMLNADRFSTRFNRSNKRKTKSILIRSNAKQLNVKRAPRIAPIS